MKGCEYCRNEKEFTEKLKPLFTFNVTRNAFLTNNNDGSVTMAICITAPFNDVVMIPINACPFCGHIFELRGQLDLDV